MKIHVGVDLGSTTTKAIVLDDRGHVVGRGITNSRSNYDVACDVAMREALIDTRFGLLDHELVEFAQRLPPRLKIRRLAGKYILRRFGEKILPTEVANRKKMPFYVPMENYFQQPVFQEMLADLLSERAVRDRGLFDVRAVGRLRDAMHRREFLFVKQVFSLMVLELGFRIFQDRSVSV